MSFRQRLGEIRTGFRPSFWVANTTELFERLAYYGAYAVLAVYLNEQMHFSKELTGSLTGFFGFVVWFLPILGGTLADRFGFRRALMFAYLVLTLGYVLLGSVTAPWMASLRGALGDKWLVLAILMIPALGPGMVKPCVAGTIARTSTEDVRSLGYGIYYTLVNIGGTLGPLVGALVVAHFGMENNFRFCALAVFAMVFVVLFFFREPATAAATRLVATVRQELGEHLLVRGHGRFVLFLVTLSGSLV